MNPSVSVVIPAFNEEKTIGHTLSKTREILESTRLFFEIIVVDDGSTDHTKECAQHHNVTLLTNGENQGKGYALQRGFRHAKGDIIVTMDADGSHNPEDLKKLLVPVLNGVDVAVGSRFVDGRGKNSTKRLHVVGNHLINLLIRIITRKRITDSQTGFRAIRRKAIEKLEIVSKGYQIETELTVKSLKNGNKVQEIPIHCTKRLEGCSKLEILRDGFRIFKTIVESSIKP